MLLCTNGLPAPACFSGATRLLPDFKGGGNVPFRAVVPHLGSPDVPRQELQEILASTDSGEGFWEFYSKNLRPEVGNHFSSLSYGACALFYPFLQTQHRGHVDTGRKQALLALFELRDATGKER